MQEVRETGHPTAPCAALDALIAQYPANIPAEAIGKFLGKDPQQIRNMAKDGRLPFAVVTLGRKRSSYIFPAGRFVAWFEGRL